MKKTIDKCLKSSCCLKEKSIEFIAVNDESTDNTKEVLFSYNKVAEFPAVAHQVAKQAYICWRYKVAINKVVLKNVRNPFGVFLVGFLAANSLHIFGVCKDNFAR